MRLYYPLSSISDNSSICIYMLTAFVSCYYDENANLLASKTFINWRYVCVTHDDPIFNISSTNCNQSLRRSYKYI